MSKLICIDCDRSELRVVVGSSGLTGVAVDQCFSQTLTIPPTEEYFDSKIFEETLKSLLSSHGVRTGHAIVTVPRNLVELRTLQVPTLDKNELPDMVRFAAQRHFASAGDNWPIDFVALGNPTEGITEVLAASINPSRIDRIQKLLDNNGLKLQQLVLRPMVASAVALLKKPELKATPAIFVDKVGEEIDMAVVDGKHVVFMRSIRLGNDLEPTQYNKTLVSEIKRTLLSAVSQNSGLKVANIVLWGSSAEWASVQPAISESLQLPTTTLDPFELVDAKPGVLLNRSNKQTGASGESPVQSTGKFAAGIGGLLAPTYHQDLIDFAHPRKREEKKTPILKYALATTAAALLLGIPIYNHYSASSELSDEIERLTNALADNKPLAEKADAKTKEWDRIQQFMNSNVNWLEELKTISKDVLPAEQVVFGNMTMVAKPGGIATITTKFSTTERENATLLQEALRKSEFSVDSKGLDSKSTLEGYSWSADLVLQKSGYLAEDPTQWGKRVAKTPAEKSTPTEDATSTPEPTPSTDSASENKPETPVATQTVIESSPVSQNATNATESASPPKTAASEQTAAPEQVPAPGDTPQSNTTQQPDTPPETTAPEANTSAKEEVTPTIPTPETVKPTAEAK